MATSNDSSASADRLAIATISKSHGIRGAVVCTVSPDHVGVLQAGAHVHIGALNELLQVKLVGGTPERPIVNFQGIETRNDADAIRGSSIEVNRADLPPLEEDEWYHSDLVGCAVFVDGRELGVVEKVLGYPANDVLEIGVGAAKPVLVPLIPEAVTLVDTDEKRIVVDERYMVEVP